MSGILHYHESRKESIPGILLTIFYLTLGINIVYKIVDRNNSPDKKGGADPLSVQTLQALLKHEP